MADGLFDDLVPERPAPAKAREGLFDDLVPKAEQRITAAARPATPNADFSGVSSRVLGSGRSAQKPLPQSAIDILGLDSDPRSFAQRGVDRLAPPVIETQQMVDPTTGRTIGNRPLLGSIPAAIAHNERMMRDPAYALEAAKAARAANPNAPYIGEVLERSDRTLGETMTDVGASARAGARRTALAYLDAPRQIVNALNTGLNTGASFLGDTGPGIPMYDQFQFQKDLAASDQALSAEDRQLRGSAAREYDLANQPEGFVNTLGYMIENPDSILDDLATSAPGMLIGGGVGRAFRSGTAGVAAGAVDQAAQAAQDVERNLFAKLVLEMPAEQAQQIAQQEAAKAFTTAMGIGFVAPKIVPGGQAFEDVMAGRLGAGTGGLLARAGVPLLGEPVSEGFEEGSIQATQNLFSRDPLMRGVGAATAKGGALGFATGAVPAGIEGTRALTEGDAGRDYRTAAEFTPDVDVRDLLGGPITEQAPPPVRAAALPPEQPRRPTQAAMSPADESLADLDALLDQLAPRAEAPSPAASPVEPPTAAPMGGEAAATQKPRVTLADVQAEQARRAAPIITEGAVAERLEPVTEPEPIAPAPERRRFASPDESVREDFVRRAGELQVSPEAAEALAPAAPRDAVTGFFDGRQGNAKTEAIERAKQHQTETDEPAVYVAADLFNLSGLNEAVGNRAETANTHYRAMAGLLNEELGRLGADVVPLRTGGDEIGFVVVNATPEQVQTAVDAAQTRVQKYAQDNNLADIPNPKRSDERGVGLHIGTAKIDRDEPVSEILNRADDGIDSSKRGRNVTGRAEQAPGAGEPVAGGTEETRGGAGEAVRQAGGGTGAVPPAQEVSRPAGSRPQQTRLDEPAEDMGPLARQEPQELTDADLTDAERAAFDRQRAVGDRTATLRAAVDQALGPVAAKVRYLRSWRDLPQGRLRNGVESRLNQRGGEGQTSALFDPKTGNVYLFTDANPSPERAVFNVLHEIAGHQGLRAFLGDQLNSALDLAAQNPTVMAVAEAIALERGIDASTDAGQRLAVEESLAELAAAVRTGNYDLIADRYGVTVPPGIRARVKAAIDNFLRRLKALLDKTFGQEFTDEDVRALLESAWQAAEGDPTLADTAGPAAVLESVEPDARAEARAATRMTSAAAEAAAEVRRNDLSQTLPAGRGTIGWQYDDSTWIGTKGQMSNARARLQDKMIAWRDVQNQIASQVGEAIPDTANVYRLENLMHGRVSTGIERIERAQVEPLVEAMRKAGVSTAMLEEYLYARHAKERNADIAAKNPAMQDGGSGMTNAEADKILADADLAKLEPLARRVDAIVRSTRQRLLDAGLITQQSFDAMESQYSAYVPLRGKRVAQTDFQPSEGGAGRGIDTRRNPVREALGRGAGNRAENLLGEVIGDAQRSVILSEKARVGRAVLRLVLTHPNPSLWQVEPVQTERTTDASGEVYERVVHDWSDPSIIAVKHRGQTYRVQINNVPLAQALSNVGVDQMGAVSRAAGAINRYFSAVLTKYNPAFLPVNATRDAIFGMTAMAAEHGELAALDAALHYPQAAAAAFRHSIGKTGGGQWDTWAAEFADAGGRTGYVAMPSVEDLSRQIGKGSLPGYSPEGVKRAAKAVADALGSMNDAVENALRLSAYVTLRKRGVSIDEAASYAKDLTVNFNRKGYDSSRLNAWFLFYNAGIQGAKRVSDVLRKPKAWAYVGGLMAAQTIAAMYAMGLEDDDGEPLWNKVPDHVKRRNLVLVLPDGGVLTVPMPYGFNVFTYLAGRIPAALTDRDEKRSNRAATVASDMLSTATESFFPVPVGDGALGLLPTVLRIPVNIQTNRDDFGREIRRESMSKFDVPRASMGKPDTLELFKLAAQGMNRVGGGDKYTPPDLSWFDVAPEDMEYLLGELGGGAGKFAIDVATVGQQLAGGELAPELKPRDIPITGRFVSSIDQQAATAALFYERRDVINRSLERVRDLYSERGVDAAEAAMKASPELTGAAFKRRKKDSDSGLAGSVIESNGRPQIIVGKNDSVFGRYKAAEEAIEARNEGVRQSFTAVPAALFPTRETRLRDASVRQQNAMRQLAQRELNAAWVRDVVGSAE